MVIYVIFQPAMLVFGGVCFRNFFSKPDTHWKINSSPLKIKPSQKESHFPTIHFQVLLLMAEILHQLIGSFPIIY